MFLVGVKRVIKSGFINFWRNGWVTLATVLVIIVTLFTIGALLFLNLLLTSTLSRLEEKVDISVYFKTDAEEEKILSFKNTLSKLDEIKSIEYTTREEALEKFKEKHKNNSLIRQSLIELDDNPLGASFNIQAKNPDQYASVSRFLESKNFDVLIDKVNYFQNERVIEQLSRILDSSKKIGVSITIFMTAIALLVSFNTIRLAIYTNREEISVMRLVGASNNYIRGPFIAEGSLYGIFAATLAIIILYFATLWLAPKAENFFGPPNIFSYYLTNFFEIFGLLILVGVILGSLSSFIAVRRYLKI